jgi:hypothetical protein
VTITIVFLLIAAIAIALAVIFSCPFVTDEPADNSTEKVVGPSTK